MTNQLGPRPALLWTALIASVALIGSYAFACVFPFAAVAAVAALTLPLPRALGLTALVWLANQIVGFAFLGYPLDSAAWGVAIGAGALGGTLAAAFVAAHFTAGPVLRSAAVLAAAFVAHEALLYLAALRLGGLDTFAPHIVAGIGLNDLGWFLMLAALRRALSVARPATFGGSSALPA